MKCKEVKSKVRERQGEDWGPGSLKPGHTHTDHYYIFSYVVNRGNNRSFCSCNLVIL